MRKATVQNKHYANSRRSRAMVQAYIYLRVQNNYRSLNDATACVTTGGTEGQGE